MAAEQDALEAHDLIDNIEHAFWKEDRMHVVIHYDPIVTGDAAVTDLRAWLGEAVKTIDPPSRCTICGWYPAPRTPM